MKISKNFKEYFVSTLLMLVLAAAYCIPVPVAAAVCGILLAALIGLQTTRYHYWYLLGSCALTLAVIALIGGIYTALFSGAPLVLSGLSLGFAANIRLSVPKTVLIFTVFYLAGMMAEIKFSGNENLMQDALNAAVPQLEAALQSVYGTSDEARQAIDLIISYTMKQTLALMPAFFILFSMAYAYIAVCLFKVLGIRRGRDMSGFAAFYDLRADRMIAILYLLVICLNLVAPAGLLADLTLNVTVILTAVFYILGLALLDYKLKTDGMKKWGRRILLFALLPLTYLFAFLPLLVAAGFGVVDAFIDFRKRSRNRLKR